LGTNNAINSFIQVRTGGILNVQGDGQLLVQFDLASAAIEGNVNVFSGTLAGRQNVPPSYGRAIFQQGGTLNIYGGSMEGRISTEGVARGEAMSMMGGTANIFGGDFLVNTGTSGQTVGLFRSGGSLTISGGYFQHNDLSMINSFLASTSVAVQEANGITVLEAIPSASATITAPVAGANPNFSPTSGDSSKYTVSVASWRRLSNNELVGTSHNFIAGETYRLSLIVTPNSGFALSSSPNPTVTLNPGGLSMTYSSEYNPPGSPGGKVYYRDFTVPANTPPTVTGIMPANGDTGVPVTGFLMISFDKAMNTTGPGTVQLNGTV
jgi:hypothetical protein